ncbi:MAG: hypothetical protein AUG44_06950 [Actinobacteria bacterium 13_1_20CM_3_71_11]|nr:MAG: hypothetical protein AUG44_06950 [Actinobacteria bacterium 13_1_20CM_3_71_11]
MSADTVAAPAPTARAPRWWDRVPPAWRFVLGLFLGTKLVVTAAALLAIHAFDDIRGQLPGAQARDDMTYGAVSPHRAVAVWFPWDALHYLRLVRMPVTGPDSDLVLQFCFPPLYPWLGKLASPLVGGSAVAALLLVSNGAFLLLLYYAYRLAERLWGEADDARRFARYVVLMPTAFIFQAALTESLFLCLVVACFYYAESRRWLVVGVLGFLAALTRSIGFLLVVPLAVLLFEQGGHRLGYLRKGWPLVLVPGGWLTFMAYSFLRTGDWQRYQHLQESRWGITLQNPLGLLWSGLVHGDGGADSVRLWFAVGYLVLMVVAARYLRPAYVVYGLIFVLMPLSIGPLAAYRSLLRYLLMVFPLALLFTRWGRRPGIDPYLTAGLALVQGVLLVTWANDWVSFII